jgi:hypothetical protein
MTIFKTISKAAGVSGLMADYRGSTDIWNRDDQFPSDLHVGGGALRFAQQA